MKIAFAHDHIFYKTKHDEIYSNGGLNKEVWNRYLKVFDKIEVISRGKSVDDQFIKDKGFSLSSRKNVRFTTIPNLSSIKGKIIHKKKSKEQLINLINDCDGLIARIPSEIGFLSIQIAKKLKKPWIVEVVSDAFDDLWNYGSIKGKIYAPISHMKMKKLVGISPYAIYVSKEALQKNYPCSGKTVSCSNVKLSIVDTKVLNNRMKKINSLEKELTIGLIGAVNNRRKGIDVAIKAINLLKENINIKLKILGGGDSEIWGPLIKKLNLEDRVEFCGILPSGFPVYNWLDNIDIYIQPSYGEGLPRSIIEAMSRGCPVIGSTVGAIPELVKEEYMHKPGNYKKLSDLIKLCFENKEMLKTMSKDNFEVAQNYEETRIDSKRTNFLNEFKEAEIAKATS